MIRFACRGVARCGAWAQDLHSRLSETIGRRHQDRLLHSVRRWGLTQNPTQCEANEREHDERELQVYFDRLRDLDESVRDLTNFFFTVNALFVGIVVQFVKDDLQQLLLAILGYAVSVATLCITYKGFLAWRLYRQDMRTLEASLDYDIQKKYDGRLKGTPGETIRVTLIRLRFSFLFVLLWVGVIIYLGIKLAALHGPLPSWYNVPVVLAGFIVILVCPWVYFVCPAKPKALGKAVVGVVRAVWGREV